MGDVTINEVLGYIIAALVVGILFVCAWVMIRRPKRKEAPPSYPPRAPLRQSYAGEDDSVGPITRYPRQERGRDDDDLATLGTLGALSALSDARPVEAKPAEPESGGFGGDGFRTGGSFGGGDFHSGGGDSSSGSSGGGSGGGDD